MRKGASNHLNHVNPLVDQPPADTRKTTVLTEAFYTETIRKLSLSLSLSLSSLNVFKATKRQRIAS